MKAILMSIQAEHNANIESGKKRGELRTRIPKEKPPFRVLTYESGKNGRHKVTNEWICRKIERLDERACFEGMDAMSPSRIEEIACVDIDYILQYKGKKEYIYNLEISDLKIYDNPRELSEFYHYCGDNPECDGCEAHYFSNTECGKEDYCCSIIDGCKPIKRPPQSWCYVEVQG